MAWNSRILSSGSRDRNILQHDLRVSSDYICKLAGHKSEVKLVALNYKRKEKDYCSSGGKSIILLHEQYIILNFRYCLTGVRAEMVP